MMDWNDGSWGFGQWLAMSVSMLVFWVLIGLAIYVIARSLWGASTPTRVTPDQLLAERFARGEIDADEYQRSLDLLHPTSSST